MHHLRKASAVLVVIAALGCESTTVAPLPEPVMTEAVNCQHPEPQASEEGEIYGRIYSGGSPLQATTGNCSGAYRLQMSGAGTSEMFVLPVGTDKGWMWEWTDASEQPCDPGIAEEHAGTHSGDEVHCVNPGRQYVLTFKEYGSTIRQIPLDYLRKARVVPAPNGFSSYVTAPSQAISPWPLLTDYLDATVSIELNTIGASSRSAYVQSAVLDVQNVENDVMSPDSFRVENPSSGLSTDWFRFSAARSAATRIGNGGAGTGKEMPLARLHFYQGSSLVFRTGYYAYAAYDPHNIIRSFRFADLYDGMSLLPKPAPGTYSYTVVLEVLGPDQAPPVDPSSLHIDQTDSWTVNITFPSGPSTSTITGPANITDTGSYLYAAKTSTGAAVNGNWSVSISGGAWTPIGSSGTSSVSYSWPVGLYTAQIRHDGVDAQGNPYQGYLTVTVDSYEPLPQIIKITGDTWVNDLKGHGYFATNGRGQPVNGNWSRSVNGGAFTAVGTPNTSSVSLGWPSGTYTGVVRHVSTSGTATLSVDVCTGCNAPQ